MLQMPKYLLTHYKSSVKVISLSYLCLVFVLYNYLYFRKVAV